MFLPYLHGIDLCAEDIATPVFSFPSLLGTLEEQECTNALYSSEFGLLDWRVNRKHSWLKQIKAFVLRFTSQELF